jgi:cell growth-regulating nucleolar protein
MTEAQKYQGALYKEKPGKNQKKGQNNQKQNGNANVKQNPNNRHQQPRVEDGSDGEGLKSAPPPPAPTPPPAGEARAPAPAPANDKPVNVFDYLVADETPNASKVTLAEPREQMTMKTNAKSVFEPSDSLARFEANPTTDDEGKNYDVAYNEHGFSYGAGNIPHSDSPPNISTEFVTPAPKKKKDRKEKAPGTVSEKKRKRGQAEVLSTPREEVDTPMMDAPSSIANNAGTPMLNHSGLTGGLGRMMRSPSPGDDSPETHRRAYQDASSPIKRSRRNGKESNGNGDPGLGISIKNRTERLVSSMFGGSSVSSTSTKPGSKALVRARRGSDSSADDQLEVRKSKKSHRSRASPEETRKSKRKSSNPTDDRPTRRLKQVDERRGSVDSPSHQVTVYRQSRPPARTDEDLQRELAHHFLSLVANGAGTERGFSVNKALKRFHRDMSDEYDDDRARDNRERRLDDEKDLWRALRLRRNDRGEIVVFI